MKLHVAIMGTWLTVELILRWLVSVNVNREAHKARYIQLIRADNL